MTKEELYNKIVNVYKESGQGVPKFVVSPEQDNINELIEENKIKIVHNTFTDDYWYCLTGVYCVEEEMLYDPYVLDYIRHFLNAYDSEINKERKLSYEKWIKDNKSQLDKIKDLPYYEYLDPILDPSNHSIIKEIKEYKFYKNNHTIEKLIETCKERIDLSFQIMNLAVRGMDIATEIDKKEEYKKKIEECTNDINTDKKIIIFLEKFDKKKNLKDCF